ncbi:FeoA domain-containing protein [Nostoc sp.]|uniref:FeoA domain-containing protein n=1 Tax=Nostoc sp. TaxID=1180 RepID=UPI002FFA3596
MFTCFSVTGYSLELLTIREQGVVTFCKSHDEIILSKLILIGILTGNIITLKQNFPSFVIKMENTSLTLNTESIRAIYIPIINN